MALRFICRSFGISGMMGRKPMEAGQFIATFPDGDGHPKWWFSKGILPKMALNQVKDL